MSAYRLRRRDSPSGGGAGAAARPVRLWGVVAHDHLDVHVDADEPVSLRPGRVLRKGRVPRRAG